jgi:3-isopropylmalate dehydrogenase
VGPEVMSQAERVLEVVAGCVSIPLSWESWSLGAERYLAEGITLREEEFNRLRDDYDAILLGALGDPRVPSNEHARDILLGLRFGLDLFVNFRPCRVLHPDHSPLRDPAGREMSLEIFRENTEGIYTGVGGNLRGGTPHEIAVQEDVNTYRGVERIIRAAFEFARRRGRERVTLVDKANAMPAVGRLWRRTFDQVSSDFDAVGTEVMYVDAMVMDLVRRPSHHQVVVTSNLFGDILSDLGAALSGGIGLAPSANLHPGRHALFEPVHGSAPDIAGQGRVNPMAAILCVALLMEHLGEGEAARRVERSVVAALEAGVATPDLGGSRSTRDVGDWIVDWLWKAEEGAEG